MQTFCREMGLNKQGDGSWDIGLAWHRFLDGQRLPPGFTGHYAGKLAALPDSLQQQVLHFIEDIRQLILDREAVILEKLGFSDIAPCAIQIAAYNAGAWEQQLSLESLSGGIGIQYHRLKAGAPPNPVWDGDLLLDKQPSGFKVTVNRADKEAYNTEEQAAALVQRIHSILDIGSEIAAWLDEGGIVK